MARGNPYCRRLTSVSGYTPFFQPWNCTHAFEFLLVGLTGNNPLVAVHGAGTVTGD
jgi:hypothetical protein